MSRPVKLRSSARALVCAGMELNSCEIRDPFGESMCRYFLRQRGTDGLRLINLQQPDQTQTELLCHVCFSVAHSTMHSSDVKLKSND